MSDEKLLRVFRSPEASVRIARVEDWLCALPPDAERVVVGATSEAAAERVRRAAPRAAFGWHAITLTGLAHRLAAARIADRGCAVVAPLLREAICARIVHAARGALRTLAPVAETPGLARALAASIEELRLHAVDARPPLDDDVRQLLEAYEAELDRRRLVDRAMVLSWATDVVTERAAHELAALPLVFCDVKLESAREQAFVAALVRRAPALFVAPQGDDITLRHLERIAHVAEPVPTPTTALGRVQHALFAPGNAKAHAREGVVVVTSAPGESRECIEIARRIHEEAARGVPFDRMAVVLRTAASHRAPLEEALRRAGIPARFSRGTRRPNPAGRAFLALLACAEQGLSAARFAEYLSLGELPPVDDGAPPQPWAEAERLVPSDDALALLDVEPPSVTVPSAADAARTLQAPRAWERFLVDSAVIGGRERWERRLAGRAAELARALDDVDEPEGAQALKLRRDVESLTALRAFALPLLHALEALPRTGATWSTWIRALGALATRALREPASVLAVLGELLPMGNVGPVSLLEVRLVLEGRLSELVTTTNDKRYGRVLVASIEEVRGLAFEVVFVAGVAERAFPQKRGEDPLMPDATRAALSSSLPTAADRAVEERLALRIALGAGAARAYVSYPRIDVEAGRPKTPSFYALEVLRAAEGELLGFEALARRASEGGAAQRLGWPAPADPRAAIDDAEYDLALLDAILRRPEAETLGMARHLLVGNVHLERALRARGRRALAKWTSADGLVDPSTDAKRALLKHALSARPFSPTALQHLAACPYRFLLQAVHRLAPREEPEALIELDAMQRGSLIHEVQFEVLTSMRARKLLPLREAGLSRALDLLEDALAVVEERAREELAPAIPRVWEDGIAALRADLREWLRRLVDDPWVPTYFELSFGLSNDDRARDPRSVDAPVALDCGLQLRGSIDVVDVQGDRVRATDHKTGKAHMKRGAVVAGGAALQPVLYALVLEKLLPDARVEGGRLYHCTHNAEFKELPVALDDDARHGAQAVADTLAHHLEQGFFPAMPEERACAFCDYQSVCGPHEERRTQRKDRARLHVLQQLRERP